MHVGYITRIKNVKQHSNADRLLVGECFGNQVIVGLDTKEGDLGFYIPTDMQLGEEFAIKNKLVRMKDEFGNNVGGYLDPKKRNIRAIKLRGEQSDGLFLGLESLNDFKGKVELKEGDTIDVINGHSIVKKYVPEVKVSVANDGNKNNKSKKRRINNYPLFDEHISTNHFAYNKHAFKPGDTVTISLKMHGTSGRTSHSLFKRHKTLLDKLLKRLGYVPNRVFKYVSGTRRVVLKAFDDSGHYSSNGFREDAHNLFVGKLNKGETVYYEIVGYTGTNKLIMAQCDNKKIGDKEFTKRYGKTTKFTYGCQEGESQVYIYRMTMTNDDGVVIEYPTELAQLRAEQMGVKHVPVLHKMILKDDNIEEFYGLMDELSDGPDLVDPLHVREGVIARIEGQNRFAAYKHKGFNFKVLEGIIKDSGVVDMEELESSQEEE